MTITNETEELARDVLARLQALEPDQLPRHLRDNMADLLAQFDDLTNEAELLASTPGKTPNTRKRARALIAVTRQITAQLERLSTTPPTQTRKENNQ